MRITPRLRRLERDTKIVFPPPRELTLRDLAPHDPVAFGLIVDVRRWKDDHPRQPPTDDPECRAKLEEIGRRFEAFKATQTPGGSVR